MGYIDGMVAAVPTAKKAEYLEHAKLAAAIFRDHGMLKIVENWGADIKDGTLTSFPLAVKCEEDETVVFSWMTWASREARDVGWEKVMADPRMEQLHTMPFDGKRMIFGGFETILDD